MTLALINKLGSTETSTEPILVTCAQARVLQVTNAIEPGREYLITDYNRGTVGPAQILTHGVAVGALGWTVSVLTAHDDSAWMGRWDPHTCRIVDLFDNLGNKIRSDNGDEVERFPWGNTAVTGNDFTDTSLAYSGGTLRDNTGEPTGYLQMSGGSVTGTMVGASADIRMTGGIVSNSRIREGRLIVDGTGRFERSSLGGNSYVRTDAVAITDSRIDVQSNIYTDGGVGRIARLSSDRGYLDIRNADDALIDDLTLHSYGRVFANNAKLIRLQYVELSNLAYAQATVGGELFMTGSTAADSALVQATAGRLEVRNTSVRDIARIQHTATGTNRVDNSTLDSYGRVFFQNDADGNQVIYGKASSLGMIRFRGTSAGNRSDRDTVASQGYLDFVNETDSLSRYNMALATGYTVLNGGTGVSVQRSHFESYGRMLIQQGSTGRVIGINVDSTGYVRLSNHAADLRYSRFGAYFYYYLTGNTAIKSGLEGHGRQTYTEPNPTTAVTGPGVRNW